MAKITIAGGLHNKPIGHLAELEDDLEKQAVDKHYAAKRKEAQKWQSPTTPS